MAPYITTNDYRTKLSLRSRIITLVICWLLSVIISIILAIFIPMLFIFILELLYNETYDILKLAQLIGIIVTPIMTAIFFIKWISDEIKYERRKKTL